MEPCTGLRALTDRPGVSSSRSHLDFWASSPMHDVRVSPPRALELEPRPPSGARKGIPSYAKRFGSTIRERQRWQVSEAQQQWQRRQRRQASATTSPVVPVASIPSTCSIASLASSGTHSIGKQQTIKPTHRAAVEAARSYGLGGALTVAEKLPGVTVTSLVRLPSTTEPPVGPHHTDRSVFSSQIADECELEERGNLVRTIRQGGVARDPAWSQAVFFEDLHGKAWWGDENSTPCSYGAITTVEEQQRREKRQRRRRNTTLQVLITASNQIKPVTPRTKGAARAVQWSHDGKASQNHYRLQIFERIVQVLPNTNSVLVLVSHYFYACLCNYAEVWPARPYTEAASRGPIQQAEHES